jgi:glycerol-3-phosphate dehydrogenase
MAFPVIPRRAQRLAALAEERFDLLVIGGGITGAGIARDAARRGLRVALVEREDFGAGTSSRSSRLIHGGVRYLEHGYLHLVFEASRERRRLLALAPHLVRPLRFTWPVYRGARIGRLKLAAGLALYDLLALFRNVGRHRRLSAAGVRGAEPALATEGLTGGASYWDAATDDARLTLANVVDAAYTGATVVNHAEVRAFVRGGNAKAGGAVEGALVHDRLGGAEIPVRAQLVVSACGPWTDEIARLEDPAARPAVRGTKGVHISVPAARVGNVGAVTMLSPDDGRVMFTLPSGAHTIIGTTDTRTAAHPHEVRADRGDVRYLLSAANRFFPGARLTEGDVVTAWAGIRPLVATARGADPASASREHAIRLSPARVLTITGGKLTTYREMAEQAVDAALRALGRAAHACDTHRVPLPGDRPPAASDDKFLVDGLPWREVDVDHAVRREMAETVGDVLVRRTTLAFEQRDQGRAAARAVAARMGAILKWTDAGIRHAVEEYEREAARLFRIDDAPRD